MRKFCHQTSCKVEIYRNFVRHNCRYSVIMDEDGDNIINYNVLFFSSRYTDGYFVVRV